MESFNVYILLGLFIVGFFIRYYPRIKLKLAFGSDTYYHLYYAGLFRENKFRVPKTSPKVVINHRLSYPYLYHFLLGIFKEATRYKIEPLLAPLFDTLSLMTFGLGISMLTELNANAYIVLQITVFLFAFSPALLKYQGMPRAFHGSPRLFGQFLYIFSRIVWFMSIPSDTAPLSPFI